MPLQIDLHDVGKVYRTTQGSVEALKGLNLTIEEGQFVCVVGPSGCGKSTLLRILSGLQRQSTGTVRIEWPESSSRPRNAIVFQEYAIFPWRTALDNVAFGPEMRGVPREERLQIARSTLAKVGLAEFGDRYPYELSGGMKQRVALARALANDPHILLMDEPFGALDAQTRAIMQQELLRIWEEERKTVVYVTHSIEEAITLGDRVALMTARPGRVKRIFDINLPRPRGLEVSRTVEFNELAQQLWQELVGEVNLSLGRNGEGGDGRSDR